MGGSTDPYPLYSTRPSLEFKEGLFAHILELFPFLEAVKVLRQWAGIIDVSPAASPIISKTPIEGFYINGGWGTGGFKATPGSGWAYAHTIARDQPHELNAAFSLERFSSGALIDEHGAAAVAH